MLNVGTGRPVSVLDVARALANELGWRGEFNVIGKFRAGDIRHCYADIERIQTLGYTPRWGFEDGVRELVAWVAGQQGASADLASAANQQLAAYGLVR